MSSPALNAVPLNFLSFISSETYEVVAESGQKHFRVHSGVLAARSEPLFAVQKDAPRKIDLSEWDSDTVGRLIEFLYIGNYQPPDSATEGEAVEKVWAKKRMPGADDEVDSLGATQDAAIPGDLGSSETGMDLLVHARVYTLAQHSGMEELRRMALQRVDAGLGEIRIHTLKETPNLPADIVGLFRYVYSHTSTQNDSQTMTPEKSIREILSDFAAEYFEELTGCEEMIVFLGEGGSFTIDVTKKVASRLCGLEGSSKMGEMLSIAQKKAQAWKNRAAVSKRKVRRLETTNGENLKKLKSTALQLEVSNKVALGKKVSTKLTVKLLQECQELRTTNESLLEECQELETFKENVRELEDEIAFLEAQVKEAENMKRELAALVAKHNS